MILGLFVGSSGIGAYLHALRFLVNLRNFFLQNIFFVFSEDNERSANMPRDHLSPKLLSVNLEPGTIAAKAS